MNVDEVRDRRLTKGYRNVPVEEVGSPETVFVHLFMHARELSPLLPVKTKLDTQSDCCPDIRPGVGVSVGLGTLNVVFYGVTHHAPGSLGALVQYSAMRMR